MCVTFLTEMCVCAGLYGVYTPNYKHHNNINTDEQLQ